MKKVLLSLLAVAALVLSCQNYDDEFDALNSKIASLESQITSLAELRTAVTGVQSSISALQTAVASAQAAAEAADNSDAITALATSVAAIAADLVDLQTAIDGATTEADLDALKTELNTTLAALQTLIETNSASISSLITSNTELKDALEELGVDVDSVLAANATFEGNLTITNDAELAYAKSLGNKVATIKGDVYVKVDAFDHTSGGDGTGLTSEEVNTVLSQITYVVGNVKVDTDESLDLSKLASVTGDYIVIGHDVSDDALLAVGDDVLFDYDGAYISNIQTADNIYLEIYEETEATATAVALVGTTSIDFTAITKASGVQSTTSGSTHSSGSSLTFGTPDTTQILAVGDTCESVKIGQARVKEVSSGATAATTELTTVELHYSADATSTNATGREALGSLKVKGAKVASVTVKAVAITGNVEIDVQAATATSNSASIDLSSTKTIGGKLTSDANSNDLSALTSVSGITLSEQKSVSLPVLTKSSSALTSGALSKDGSITLTEATSFSAPKLATVGAAAVSGTTPVKELRAHITANKVEGAVSLPELVIAGELEFTTATSISAPKAIITSVDLADTATSVELASVNDPATGIKDGAKITTLKLHAQRGKVGTVNSSTPSTQEFTPGTTAGASVSPTEFDAFVELTNLTFKGYIEPGKKADVNLSINTLNVDLTTIVLGGGLNVVDINTTADGTVTYKTAKLTSITTDGIIHDFTAENNFNLGTLSLGHKEDPYQTVGPKIQVIKNVKLNSFSTAVTMISVLDVRNNWSLSSFDASSIVSVPENLLKGDATGITITVTGNLLQPGDVDDIGGTAAAATAGAANNNKWASMDGIKGTYTPLSAGNARSYGQSALASLNGLFTAIDEKYTDSAPADADYPALKFNMEYFIDVTTGTTAAVDTVELDYTGDWTDNDSVTIPTTGNLEILTEVLKIQ